jgi:hypothetical protein
VHTLGSHTSHSHLLNLDDGLNKSICKVVKEITKIAYRAS